VKRLILLVLLAALLYSMSSGGGGRERDGDPPIDGVDGLHVLIVEESQDRHKLSQDKMAVLTGGDVRAWLKANTDEDGDGAKGFRFWDQDQLKSLENESDEWQAIGNFALSADTPAPPWILVADGAATTIQPLPEDPEATVDFLEAWAD